jgi:hypothetical protein
MILGRESHGGIFAYYPLDGTERSIPVLGGASILLPGAAELDDSTGVEEIVLVACNTAFTIEVPHEGCEFRHISITRGIR